MKKLVSESQSQSCIHSDHRILLQAGEEGHHPLVLACGFTRIVQSKAGNHFPAWHVFCPVLEQDVDKVDGGGTTASCGLQWQTCWRSKRDFLRLGRAMAQARGHFQDGPRYTPFPKAAFQKLSMRAPWHRPLDTSSEVSSKNSNFGGTQSSNHPSKKSEANNFDVSMKKSLLQMDQFLQCAYYYSCRPIHMDQNAASSGGRENETDDPFLQMKRAWEDFCQPVDSSDVFSPSQHASETTGPLQVQRSPQSLGQYFCSSENAEQLVKLFWNKVLLQAHMSSDVGNDNQLSRDFLILEPSCGHGKIIWTLLEKHIPSVVWNSHKSTSILGMDIDSCAIQKCRDDPCATALSKNLGHHNDDVVDLRFVCHDFLKSKRSDYCSENCIVVAIGGPPYGTNPKDRDLPLQFAKHCIQEWKAQVVAFLVPERFSQQNPIVDNNAVNSPETGPIYAYSVECQALVDSTFYYRGDTPYKQPSRIQCWYQESSLEHKNVGAV